MELTLLMFLLLYSQTKGTTIAAEKNEVNVIAVVMIECDYDTAESYCNRMSGELADKEFVEEQISCIKQTIGPRPNRKYWTGEDEDCEGSKSKYCAVEVRRDETPRFKYERSKRKDYFSLCEVDLSTYQAIPNINFTLCSSFTATRSITSELTSINIMSTLLTNNQLMTERTTELDKDTTSMYSLLTTTPMSELVTSVTEEDEKSSTVHLHDNEKSSQVQLDNSKGQIVAAVIVVVCIFLIAIGAILAVVAVRRVHQKQKRNPKMIFHNQMYKSPDKTIHSSATDSNKYFVLDESTYSEVKENEMDNFTNNNSQSPQATTSQAYNQDGMYNHMQRIESETGNDVRNEMYSHLDSRSVDGLLKQSMEGNEHGDGMYDHLEGKRSLEKTKEIGKISSDNLTSEYDHTGFCKDMDTSSHEYDHTIMSTTVYTPDLHKTEEYEHLAINNL